MHLARSTSGLPAGAGESGGWATYQRRTIYLCAAVLGICLLFMLIYFHIIWNVYADGSPGHTPPFGDFFALWSYAKLSTDHPVVELYDMALLHDRQVTLGMRPDGINPFPYPPFVMFLFRPLSWLPYDEAYLAWIISSLALFIWAVRGTCTDRLFGLLFVAISPAATANIFMGQSGFLSAAVLTAGLRLAALRPVVSGILLGLLSVKPQLGILVPIALAAAGLWTTIIAAGATVVFLSLAATCVFGYGAWSAWLSMLPAYADMVDGSTNLLIMPTVIANLRFVGVSLAAAKGVQAVAALAVAIVVARCFRRGPGPLATAVLLVGVFLATPHAFLYDLQMVTAAMALFVQARLECGGGKFSTVEVVSLLLAALFPIAMLMKKFPLPISTVTLALLFIVIVRAHNRSATWCLGAATAAADPRRIRP